MDPSSPESTYANPEKAGDKSLSDEKHLPPAYEESSFGVEDGLPPTEEEKENLRRVADKIPWNAFRKLALLIYFMLALTCVTFT